MCRRSVLFCYFDPSPSSQGWADAVARRRGDEAAGVAAAALYVLEVTRANAQWAAWAERDTAFVR